MADNPAICDLLESAVRGRIYADVSKTALPFFEGRGYKIIAPQRSAAYLPLYADLPTIKIQTDKLTPREVAEVIADL